MVGVGLLRRWELIGLAGWSMGSIGGDRVNTASFGGLCLCGLPYGELIAVAVLELVTFAGSGWLSFGLFYFFDSVASAVRVGGSDHRPFWQLGNQEPFKSSAGRSGEMEISRLIGYEVAWLQGLAR